MRAIRVIGATLDSKSQEATTIFELDVVPGLCSPMERMHGGAMALLVDMATTMAAAPISSEGWWEFGGVSRTLSVTYLRPTMMNTTIVVECVVRGIGANLCRYILCCVPTSRSQKS